MINFRTPGVFIEESSRFPASVRQVETCVPAFIGYTETGPSEPTRITSLVEYQSIFGGPAHELPEFEVDTNGVVAIAEGNTIKETPAYAMYYMLDLYFANGGGACYIVSAGPYKADLSILKSDLSTGTGRPLTSLETVDEPTIIVFTDAPGITSPVDYHTLLTEALSHCANVGGRFLICDVLPADSAGTDPVGEAALAFRNGIGINYLMHGAAYYPGLKTVLKYRYNEDKVVVSHEEGGIEMLRYSDAAIAQDPAKKEKSLFYAEDGAHLREYVEIKQKIKSVRLVLPASAAIAGIYAMVDHAHGVWKAPANVSLSSVIEPTVPVSHAQQEGLNVSSTGKSINAIRSFAGRGTLVWGARTLDGNNNEWRYIATRRFSNMVERSIKNAIQQVVFEPNDANTWVKVKAMIENFLAVQWRNGALAGAQPKQAFFVKIGLGETMTPNDIQDGKMIIEIGMAVIRPAEFIMLRVSQTMIKSLREFQRAGVKFIKKN